MRAMLGLTVLGLLSAGTLAGCVADRPELRGNSGWRGSAVTASPDSAAPGSAGAAALATNTVNPGDPIDISYTLPDGLTDVASIGLIGLPTADGGAIGLPVPTSPGPQTAAVTIPAPMRAGAYRLGLRIATSRGKVSSLALGAMTVNQMPARLSEAAITPSPQRAGACAGGTLTAQLSYTVASPNGAAAVSEIRLLPTKLLSALPVLPSAPLDLRHPTALAPAPTMAGIESFPVRSLAMVAPAPQQVASARPVARDGTFLSPSQRWDVVSDRVTTPIEIPCSLPAPTVWSLPIVGVVGGAQPTNQVVAEYRVNP